MAQALFPPLAAQEASHSKPFLAASGASDSLEPVTASGASDSMEPVTASGANDSGPLLASGVSDCMPLLTSMVGSVSPKNAAEAEWSSTPIETWSSTPPTAGDTNEKWTLTPPWAEREEKIHAAWILMEKYDNWEAVFHTFRRAKLEIPQHIIDLSTWSDSPLEDTRLIREAFIASVPRLVDLDTEGSSTQSNDPFAAEGTDTQGTDAQGTDTQGTETQDTNPWATPTQGTETWGSDDRPGLIKNWDTDTWELPTLYTWDDAFEVFAKAGVKMPEHILSKYILSLKNWEGSPGSNGNTPWNNSSEPWNSIKSIRAAFLDAEMDYQTAEKAMTLACAEPRRFFTCFPKLPAEIRIKIWKYSLPGPRLVVLQYDDHGQGEFTSTARIPTNLHVNKESRHEALKVYKLCFAPCRDGWLGYYREGRHTDEPHIAERLPPPKIFFSFELDTVIFARKTWTFDLDAVDEIKGWPTLFRYLSDKDVHSIQNLMVLVEAPWMNQPSFFFDYTYLLKSLKKFTILFANHGTRIPHRIEASAVEELPVGDRGLNPYDFLFLSRIDWSYTPDAMQADIINTTEWAEYYLQQQAQVVPWTRVPDVVLAQPRARRTFVNSILDLCF